MAALNALEAVRQLEDSGADRRLAETVARLLQDAANTPPMSELATKEDLKPLATKQELAELKAALLEQMRAQMLQFAGIVGVFVAAGAAFVRLA